MTEAEHIQNAQSAIKFNARDWSQMATVKSGENPIEDLQRGMASIIHVSVATQRWKRRAEYALIACGLAIGALLGALALETAVLLVLAGVWLGKW